MIFYLFILFFGLLGLLIIICLSFLISVWFFNIPITKNELIEDLKKLNETPDKKLNISDVMNDQFRLNKKESYNIMTKEELKSMSKEEVLNFIRKELKFDNLLLGQIHGIENTENQHRRFEMSGYDMGKTGSCTIHNMNILNTFAYLGIYDYTKYLVVEFYKGIGIIYWEYWGSNEKSQKTDYDELSIWTTSEIIYKVFELTIFSGRETRRR